MNLGRSHLTWIGLALLLSAGSPAAARQGLGAPADGAHVQPGQKTILALYPTRREAPATTEIDRGLRRILGLQMPGRLDFYSEFIDLERFEDPSYQVALREFFRRKFEGLSIDLIIATSDATFRFATMSQAELFQGVPVVFSAGPGTTGGTNATGVTSELNFRATVRLAMRLQPDTEQVFVVSGAAAWDRYYETLAREQFKAFDGRLAFTYLSGLPMPELLQRVATLPERAVVYFTTMVEDGSGRQYLTLDTLDQVVAVANRPIYIWHSVAMGRGVVGGSLQDPSLVAEGLGSLALRVLNGEDPSRIPIRQIDSNVVEFDWRQMNRWGIDERRAPPGSEIRFRMPGIWERYQPYILAGLSLLFLQTVLIGTLLTQRSRRRRTEASLRASHDEVQHLAGRVIAAQEAERTRIARDLHDDVSQRLAGISIGLSGLRRQIASKTLDPAVSSALSSLQELAIMLGESIRTLSHDLHPGVLEHAGLVAALSSHCVALQQEHPIMIRLRVGDDIGIIPPGHALCLYRVAQEALRNVISHAGATEAEVGLVRTRDGAELTITDNGKGFDTAEPKLRSDGLGLISINERVRLAGGTVDIVSSPKRGTSVQVSIPMDGADAPASVVHTSRSAR